MKVIHRFDIFEHLYESDATRFIIELPEGARVVHVGLQDRAPHRPCMWVELDPEERRQGVKFFFQIVGTGKHEIEEGWSHVGTWQGQGYVWHLYQEDQNART